MWTNEVGLSQMRANPWMAASAIIVATLLGIIVPLHVSLFDSNFALILALPLLVVVGLIFTYDRMVLLVAILLLRAGAELFLNAGRTAYGGAGSVLNLCVILIALLAVIDKPGLLSRRVLFMWAGFYLSALVGVLMAPERLSAARSYLTLVSNLAVFLSAFHYAKDRKGFDQVVWIIVGSSLLPALYAFVDLALYRHVPGFRLRSTFSHPNVAAFYFNLIITLCFYLLKSSITRLTGVARAAMYLYLLLILGLLALTQTRSAWIACILFFAAYGLLFERRFLIYLIIGISCALMLPVVHERLLDLASGNHVSRNAQQLNSFAWRLLLWKSALNWMQPDHYLFGYGLGGFRFHTNEFFPLAGGIHWDAHNVYMEWFFDVGLVGVITYFWVHVQGLRGVWHLYGTDRLAAFSVGFAILGYLIVSASDNMLSYLVFNWYFWFLVGAACSLAVSTLQGSPGRWRTPADTRVTSYKDGVSSAI